MEIKRSSFLFFFHRHGDFLNIANFLQGEFEFSREEQILALPILFGEEIPLEKDEFNYLTMIPDDKWVKEEELIEKGISKSFIDKFSKVGIILKSDSTEQENRFKEREEILKNERWNIYAALYHFMTKWNDIDVELQPDQYQGGYNVQNYKENMQEVIDIQGIPPSHFHEPDIIDSKISLKTVEKGSELYDLLLKRKTHRVFDEKKKLSQKKLSTILYYVFGCHGLYKMHDQMTMLKKTSPSGGSLHPTEVYVLIVNVEGIDPGLYHYNVKDHTLGPIKFYSEQKARNYANEFTAGQNYPSSSNALFLMTSRYFRNFWKYQRHSKSYSVLMMDAAHLSQSFYLVCTQLNLGPFVTGAINTELIENELNIDGFREGSTLIVGCGHPIEEKEVNLLEPEFENFNSQK